MNYQNLFKASPAPQLVLLPDRPNYTICEVNNAYLFLTQSKESDFIGRPLFEAFPENPMGPGIERERNNLIASFEYVIKNKKAHTLDMFRYDIPVRGSEHFDERYWVPTNYPVLGITGEVNFIIHSPVDVTTKALAEIKEIEAQNKLKRESIARVRIQEQLVQEKTFAESLINSLPGVFYLFDEDGKLHRWNKNLEEITGYSSEEIRNIQPMKLIAKRDITKVKEAVRETFQLGTSEVEAKLSLKNGQTLPYLFNGLAIQLNGAPLLIGTGLDISELERERVKRMYLSEILEKSRNEIYIFHEQTLCFIDVNAGARENLGFTLDELKEMTPLDLMPDFYLESFQDLLAPLRSKKKERVVCNTVHRRFDGSVYDVEVHLQLTQHKGFKVFVAIIIDITERLKIEAQIKGSLREKEVLLTEIHHRVKNNLAIISSLLYMQTLSVDDKKAKQILMDSQGRVQSMAMIHELLYQQEDFSQIDFSLYLNRLYNEVSANYQDDDRQIIIDINADSIFFDLNLAVPCALLLNELLTNAYKHAFVNRNLGNIKIGIKQDQGFYTLVFSDDGIGMPDNDINSLGLTLIHGLAKQIGGVITVSNDEGTTYTIVFPDKYSTDPDSSLTTRSE